MRWKLAALPALVALVATAAIAYGATNDQGRRLAGPFCVGKTFLQPIDGTRLTTRPAFKLAILRAGVVRSVAATQPCRPWENRKVGLAIPDPDVDVDPATPGPAGPAGANGSNGATGATGPQGLPGKNGVDGMNGKDGKNGTDGTNGKDGKDGTNGPGNDTVKVCVRDDGLLSIVADEQETTTTVAHYDKKGGGGDQHRCVKFLTVVIVK